MATPVATITPLSRFNGDDDLFGSESISMILVVVLLIVVMKMAVMSYQNKVDTSPWCRSYGGWQVSTCNPYCSHGGLVLCIL
ncbi:hypothetical protein Hanom_Chr04g00368601 [Helianthus anomalus]